MAGGPTVTLTFAGDASKLNSAMDGIGSSAASMSGKVDSSSGSIHRSTGALNKFGDAADSGEGKAQGFSDIIGGSTDIFTAFGDSTMSTGDKLQQLGGGIADLSGGIASFLVPALSAGVGGIKAMSIALLTSPITWIVVGIGLIVGAFILLWQNFEGFRNFWKSAWEGIKSVAGGVIDTIVGIVKGFANLIIGIFTLDFGRAKDGAIAAFSGILKYVTTIPRLILGALGNLGSLLVSAGGDLLRGLWNGISGAASWLKNKVMGWAGSILPGWVKKILGIHSPSTVFADLGQWIPKGLAVGMEANLAPVEDASAAMSGAAMGDYMAGAGSYGGGGRNSGATVTFAGGTDSAFANAFMKLVRTGQIQIQAG